MQSQITARDFDLYPDLRDHVDSRLAKLERYYDGIINAHVILEESNAPSGDKKAEINIDVYQKRLSAEDTAPTYEQAINQCVNHLRRQLKKYKARLRSTDKDAHR
jgi:putative sigma-54 modulation protein